MYTSGFIHTCCIYNKNNPPENKHKINLKTKTVFQCPQEFILLYFVIFCFILTRHRIISTFSFTFELPKHCWPFAWPLSVLPRSNWNSVETKWDHMTELLLVSPAPRWGSSHPNATGWRRVSRPSVSRPSVPRPLSTSQPMTKDLPGTPRNTLMPPANNKMGTSNFLPPSLSLTRIQGLWRLVRLRVRILCILDSNETN